VLRLSGTTVFSFSICSYRNHSPSSTAACQTKTFCPRTIKCLQNQYTDMPHKHYKCHGAAPSIKGVIKTLIRVSIQYLVPPVLHNNTRQELLQHCYCILLLSLSALACLLEQSSAVVVLYFKWASFEPTLLMMRELELGRVPTRRWVSAFPGSVHKLWRHGLKPVQYISYQAEH
jgi:hypothetical protein